MPASYLSPKTQVRRSPIEGRGLFARRAIRKGEIVAIKGGHILDDETLARVKGRIADSFVQIADGFYIGAMTTAEVRKNKIFINHSCEPNLGIRGQIIYVARHPAGRGAHLRLGHGGEPRRSHALQLREHAVPEASHRTGLEEAPAAAAVPRPLLRVPRREDSSPLTAPRRETPPQWFQREMRPRSAAT